MEDKNRNRNDINKYILFSVVFVILVFLYVILLVLNYDIAKKYNNTILPCFYIDKYDMSNYSFDKAYKLLEEKQEELLEKKMILVVNSKIYEYTLKDLGLTINVDKTFDNIKNYQKNLSFSRKLWFINGKKRKRNFKIFYTLNDDSNISFLNAFRDNTYIEPINGYFDTSSGVKYIGGVDGFALNVDKSHNEIKDYFNGKSNKDSFKLKLSGEVLKAVSNESYKSIDTMTSSFVTTYDTWIYARAQNLRSAMNYINGAIVEPGEIFSYHSYAGPYDKDGYVFYYKYVGNGVCQVATTVYNAALLGGLEIVKRSPHDKKSEYVAGGLDATVADYGSWNVDMQWKNTYDYPIYVKSYDYNGEVHVEFWSNHDAMGGKTYSTESQWLGGRSYRSFLHTYKDGAEIDVHEIDYTYYIKD